MSLHCWEDAIRPAGCGDAIAARDAAMAEQRAAIQALREGPALPAPPPPIVSDGAWVTELRERIGITQRELAALCGVCPRSVLDWERGYKRVSDEHAETLMQIDRDYPTVEPMTAGRAIAIREAAGMTISEFARAIGVDKSTVAYYESGRFRVGLKTGRAIGAFEQLVQDREATA